MHYQVKTNMHARFYLHIFELHETEGIRATTSSPSLSISQIFSSAPFFVMPSCSIAATSRVEMPMDAYSMNGRDVGNLS